MSSEYKYIGEKMLLDKQWKEDNGPVDFDLGSYFRNTGKTEKTSKVLMEGVVPVINLTVDQVLKEFDGRGKMIIKSIVTYVSNNNYTLQKIAKEIGCHETTVSKAVSEYHEVLKKYSKTI